MIKRYLSMALAAVALTGFGQPLLAAPHQDGKKKGRGGAKHAAPVQVQHAKASQSGGGGHRITASSQRTVVHNQARAPRVQTTSSVAQRSVVRERTRVSQQAPTVALGGSQFRSTRYETRDRWDGDHSEGRYYRPPVDVYRHWDHGRVHTWNSHRYHWYDGAWVILNANVGYDYPGYDYPTTYIHQDVPSGSLAAQVQGRLAREGYDPGPIDGVIGPQTRDAIAAFQSDHGLPTTGRIDNSLVNALGL